MSILLKAAFVILTLGSSFFAGRFAAERVSAPTQTVASFGAFTPVQGQTYTLQGAGVNATQTTIPLASFTTPDGRALTMSMFGSIGYGAIEPNTTSKIEDITFTGITQNANGSAVLTGVSRGLDFVSPYLASSTLGKAHAGGSYFILSNTAGFYGQQFLFAGTNSTSSAVMVFGSTTPPRYDADPIWANFSTQVLADVSYVNSVVAAGAANASETVKGIIQLATGAQSAAGTSAGSTGARLVVPNSLATSTPYSGTPQGSFPTSAATGGKISQLWIDLTQAFSFSGGLTSTATTTLNCSNRLSNACIFNGIAYSLPTNISAGSSSVLAIDANGSQSWNQPSARTLFARNETVTTTATSPTTTLQTYFIPANTPSGSGVVKFSIQYGFVSASTFGCNFEVDYLNSSRAGTTTLSYTSAASPPGSIILQTDVMISGSGGVQYVNANTNTASATNANVITTTYNNPGVNFNLAAGSYLSVAAIRNGGATAQCTVFGVTGQVINP